MGGRNKFKSLDSFLKQFGTEEACLQYFEKIRYQSGIYCSHCGHRGIYRFSENKRLRCAKCRQDFSIKCGTIFGDSKLPLQKWFVAIYLLSSSEKGIAPDEFARQIGVTQKTARFLEKRIRAAVSGSSAENSV